VSLYGSHIVNQLKAPLVSDNTLHVIGVISNYARYHSRVGLFRQWYERMQAMPNVKLYVHETAFGDRGHEITDGDNASHLQTRTNTEIWVKENQINLAVRYLLPRNWKYMAWIDCDIEFRDPNWAMEAMQQLQHFALIQPFRSAVDLGPHGDVMQTFDSFGYRVQTGKPLQVNANDGYAFGHPGFAWACRRDFYEAVGGLLDVAILGSGDTSMAWGAIGRPSVWINPGVHDGYKAKVAEWSAKAVQITHKQVGYSSGRIEHSFHGAKVRRGYLSRWQILIDHKFNPVTDLRYDSQGLLRVIGKPGLEAAIHQYNLSRNEDSIDA
jgi:hypothetical protein